MFQNITNNEPAVGVGAGISAIVVAAIALFNAFGGNLSEAQTDAIIVFIGALIAVPIIQGFLTRALVYPKSTVEAEVANATWNANNTGYRKGYIAARDRFYIPTPVPAQPDYVAIYDGLGDDGVEVEDPVYAFVADMGAPADATENLTEGEVTELLSTEPVTNERAF